MTGIRKEFVNRHIEKYLSDTGTDLDDFKWEEYQQWLESELLKAQEHIDNIEFLLKLKNEEIYKLNLEIQDYDRLMEGRYR